MAKDWNGIGVTIEGAVHGWLVRHSIQMLRFAMGLIFLGFGVLKFFPGVSPAQGLAEATIAKMTDGIVPNEVGLLVTAVLECVIGLSLITARYLRVTVYLLIGELLGILSPVVLLPGRLFAGPHHAPTLEGQYVVKDIILAAAAMVVATQFRGARITTDNGWTPARTVPVEPAEREQAGSVTSDDVTPVVERAAEVPEPVNARSDAAAGVSAAG